MHLVYEIKSNNLADHSSKPKGSFSIENGNLMKRGWTRFFMRAHEEKENECWSGKKINPLFVP